jgi:hypothetical protein
MLYPTDPRWNDSRRLYATGAVIFRNQYRSIDQVRDARHENPALAHVGFKELATLLPISDRRYIGLPFRAHLPSGRKPEGHAISTGQACSVSGEVNHVGSLSSCRFFRVGFHRHLNFAELLACLNV